MQHIESSVKIYFTREYTRFAKLNGNRQLNMAKINKIKKDIEAGLDMLKLCPILVAAKGELLEVIDGQHRLEVAKQVGSCVWYIIADELTLAEIAKVNSRTEKWKGGDFINCYSQQGNESYVLLEAYMQKYKFPVGVAVKLLATGSILSDASFVNKELFESGQFVANKRAEAMEIGDTILKFSSFSGHKTRAFIVAICKILDAKKVAIADVIAAYNNHSDKLKLCANPKGYLLALETIMNIGKHVRVTIY